MLSAVSLSAVTFEYKLYYMKRNLIIGSVPIIFLMEIPSHVSAKTQSWNSMNVCKVMSYQDSGDCSAEPG